jgi:hypothetical protein
MLPHAEVIYTHNWKPRKLGALAKKKLLRTFLTWQLEHLLSWRRRPDSECHDGSADVRTACAYLWLYVVVKTGFAFSQQSDYIMCRREDGRRICKHDHMRGASQHPVQVNSILI